MLDGWARPRIDPALDRIAGLLARIGVTANAVTFVSCGIGLLAGAAVWRGWFWIGLVLMLASRIGDGLDGAIARIRGKTDLGGLLDIVLDFAFYGAIPLGFVLHDPQANGVAGAVLLFAFYVNGGSVLAYAVMAEKQGLAPGARGRKALLFTTGLAEATETIAVFATMCVVPTWFPLLAYGFAAMTGWTTVSRLVLASRTL